MIFKKEVFRFFKIKGFIVRSLSMMLFLVLFALGKKKKIVFFQLTHHRIGHLALEAEVFLRRRQTGQFSKGNVYVGISRTPPANRQLLDMIKRKTIVLESNFIADICTVFPLRKSKFQLSLPSDANEYYELKLNAIDPSLTFTHAENRRGKRALAEMGIKEEDWFVCFSARDQKYLNTIDSRNENGKWDYHIYRNADIKNYLLAARYIVDQGGFAIRVGSVVDKPLPNDRHPRIIDYSLNCRSDFMDIYLLAHCKFSFGVNSGIQVVPMIFNVPTIYTNVVPINDVHFPAGPKDRFITKKLWLRKKRRYLSFKEIIENNIDFQKTCQYEEAGIDVIENSPEDILDVVVEMNKAINGTYAYSEEDEKMQKIIHKLFNMCNANGDFPSRMGAKYLQKYKYLLGDN